MEEKNLEQVKDLIEEIADCYDLPSDKEAEEMRKLTGIDWNAEDLQTICCEYWSHHSLEETAYMMFNEEYPPVNEAELVFWRYKENVTLNDADVFKKYRLGKDTVKGIETLPFDEILNKIKSLFPMWTETDDGKKEESYRFECKEQESYWSDTHFWIFLYGLYGKSGGKKNQHQIINFSCHNMSNEQINIIIECMESFGCKLHIKEYNIQ